MAFFLRRTVSLYQSMMLLSFPCGSYSKLLPVVLFVLHARQPGCVFLACFVVVAESFVEIRHAVCKLLCSQISIVISLDSSVGAGVHRLRPVVGEVRLCDRASPCLSLLKIVMEHVTSWDSHGLREKHLAINKNDPNKKYRGPIIGAKCSCEPTSVWGSRSYGIVCLCVCNLYLYITTCGPKGHGSGGFLRT